MGDKPGWKHSGVKAIRVKIARLRRVGGQLLSNLNGETHRGHRLSAQNHLDLQRRVLERHMRDFETLPPYLRGLDAPIHSMRAIFCMWRQTLDEQQAQLHRADGEPEGGSSAIVESVMTRLQTTCEDQLYELVDLRRVLKGDAWERVHDGELAEGIPSADESI